MKRNLNKIVVSVAAVAAALVTASANAALDPAVSAAVTVVDGDAKAIYALIVPVVAAVMGMGIVLKLMKRFSNKV